MSNELQSVNTGLSAIGGSDIMGERLVEYEKIMQTIRDYVKRNFVPTVDFGASYPGSNKPTLLKPGAEKICRMFRTRPEWTPDLETWKMLGSEPGNICMRCTIISNETGAIIGEGRGACKVGEKKTTNENQAIKIAQKRALVDAALYTFMLSELFTQDEPEKVLAKNQLWEDIKELRRGVETEINDNEWCKIVFSSELHKNYVETKKEADYMRKVIFDDKKYNLSTGERQK